MSRLCVVLIVLLGACARPLSDEAADDLSALAGSAASMVGAPAEIQAELGREAAENRALCRYLSTGAVDLGAPPARPAVSALAREQAAAGRALDAYVAALVEASRGESLQGLRDAQARFGGAVSTFASAAGSGTAGGLAAAGLEVAQQRGEARRQREIREIMRQAIDPLFLLEALLKRDVGAVAAQTDRAVAAWEREARCLLRASRSRAEAPEVFEDLTRRRQEIGRQVAAVRTAPEAVETLRVAHILAVTEPDGFRQSIATVVEVLSEMDALRGIAAN